MQWIDFVLLAALAASVTLSVRRIWKLRGGCGGDCASCRGCAQQKQGRTSFRK